MIKTKIGFYGDDFTGASDNAAQYHRHGLRTLLYFSNPEPAALRQAAAEYDVIGVAGTARSMNVVDMAAEVLPVLRSFQQLQLPLIQYKCCSTLDSTPSIGSLGEAARLMRSVWPDSHVPVLAAAPEFGRYTLFGNHFARAKDGIYRLDRHPTMSRHPVTPMSQADIRLLLQSQGFDVARLVDLPELDQWQSDPAGLGRQLAQESDTAVFDTYSEQQLTTAAGSIWELAQQRQVTAVAAQGFAFGVGNYLKNKVGQQAASAPQHLAACEKILVVSGSCSPQSAAQIDWAEQAGFECLRISVDVVLRQESDGSALSAIENQVVAALQRGRSVVVYTARGLDDPSLEPSRIKLERLGIGAAELANRFGALYARLLRAAIERAGVRRLVVAGGDSSSFTMRHLGARALAVHASHYAQNAHFCRILADDAVVDGVQVLLKGGQVGSDALYGLARDGFTLGA
ncbi:four-carbon acid sugar kinase family protein [Herbaspirillum sp. RTI4]|uniref:four-carbon acid sugar kinase family protein n=1 Tax=Herbaspirillum sp. RTI4 TaxID=3048640 RepID=UPI002AB503A5|nr:four-carbon acid sugar kinase family protein [Herbaspirillum sp. RTI4]MDY7577114.1 four-carbon acid sugar kinase family protein [Herbaspirillum sp. RTI4]MEA9982856.1 four-carbon acid sugar kinase family protein [Herbaspirillum sp. RTI4]